MGSRGGSGWGSGGWGAVEVVGEEAVSRRWGSGGGDVVGKKQREEILGFRITPSHAKNI